MTYSELSDIEARLPFTVNNNSIPTSTQLTGLQDQANWTVNGYLGRTADLIGAEASGCKIIEIDLTTQLCMNWHEGYFPEVRLAEHQKVILDNLQKTEIIDSVDMEWDNY